MNYINDFLWGKIFKLYITYIKFHLDQTDTHKILNYNKNTVKKYNIH